MAPLQARIGSRWLRLALGVLLVLVLVGLVFWLCKKCKSSGHSSAPCLKSETVWDWLKHKSMFRRHFGSRSSKPPASEMPAATGPSPPQHQNQLAVKPRQVILVSFITRGRGQGTEILLSVRWVDLNILFLIVLQLSPQGRQRLRGKTACLLTPCTSISWLTSSRRGALTLPNIYKLEEMSTERGASPPLISRQQLEAASESILVATL